MYAVISNKSKEILAYNKRYKVCVKYIKNIKQTYENIKNDEINLSIINIKDKKARLDPDFDELYLVRYSDTYIQSGYIDYLSIQGDQVMYDNQYAFDVLLRFLDTDYPLSKKDKKHIEYTLAFLNEVIKENKKYTPTLDDLKGIKEHYDSYIYSVENL